MFLKKGLLKNFANFIGKYLCQGLIFYIVTVPTETLIKITYMWRRWAHLRIPVSNLLINLKNNYLLKNCWSGPIKNVRILIFTMLHFFKEIKKNTCYFTLVYQKSWWYAHSFTEIGNYGSFFAFYPPLKTWKIRILKKKKKCWRYHHFTNVHQKPQPYEVWFLRYRVRQTEFFVFLAHFLPFYPP